MVIYLTGASTIKADDTLAIKAGQTILVDLLDATIAFTGKIHQYYAAHKSKQSWNKRAPLEKIKKTPPLGRVLGRGFTHGSEDHAGPHCKAIIDV